MSDALKGRDRVRVNRTRRHREQGGFSGFSPWPTKWQPSPYPARPALRHRRQPAGPKNNH
jgi:hypothetical protein